MNSKINFFRLFFSRHKILEACFVSFVLILATFPDVFFLKASLRLTDQIAAHHSVSIGRPIALKNFYHIPNLTGWHAGYNDPGGAVFQSEPIIAFMRYCISNLQSPYWNPYSAAGSVGPETLVDLKFSALTILNAVLGTKSIIYNTTMLLLLFFATFFMYRTAREKLELSALSSTGTAIFYLLNGYSAANFGSNVTQSYLYVPMCLFASLNFIQSANISRFVALVFSFTIFLSCTFIPTTCVSLLAIYTIIIGYIAVQINQNKLNYHSGATLFVIHFLGITVSLFLLAILYLPIVENIKSIGTLDHYAKRIFYPIHFPLSLASLFSSTHVFELYNAIEPKGQGINGNVVYHMGVIAIALSGCCYSIQKIKYSPLIITCIFCITLMLCRMFNWPFFSYFSEIPIVGHFGCQYWWPAIMIPMTILVGFGINNLQKHNARIAISILLLVIGTCLIAYIYKVSGVNEPHASFKINALTLLSILCAFVIFALLKLKIKKKNMFSCILLYGLVTGMFIELMIHSKMVRFGRNNFYLTPPDAITYVRKNVGLYRTLNFGSYGLYPELGSAFQIQDITSMNQGTIPSYLAYFNSAINLGALDVGGFPTLRVIKDEPLAHKFDWKALNLLGLKYILLPPTYSAYKADLIHLGLKLVYETPSTLVFENPNVLPRAFAVEFPASEVDQSITLPTDFYHRLHQTQITSYQNASVEIQGTAPTELLVVLSDNWHQNWRATMNGLEAPIIKVNGTFRGIFVPQGSYIIKMHYQPRTLPLAIGISAGTFFLLVFLILRRRNLDKAIARKFFVWKV